MHLQLDATKVYSLAELWMLAPEIVVEELTSATLQAEGLLQREVQDRAPLGLGILKQSVQQDTPQVLSGTVIGVVGSALSYAEAVEFGTKPHAVSPAGVASIEDWVRHKLGISPEEAERVANAVAWKIRKFGSKGAHMFEKSLEASGAQIEQMYNGAAETIASRLGAV